MPNARWDVFISHASEDLAGIAAPLAQRLREAGLTVWLDAHQLRLGDPLRRRIDDGLAGSRYGVLLVSPSYLAKAWPQDEMRAMMALEDDRHPRLLPVLCGVTRKELAARAPLLADRLAVDLAEGLDRVASRILEATGPGKATVDDDATVLVDMAHDQGRWEHLRDAFPEPARFRHLCAALTVSPESLERARVLVMPMPFHQRLARAEIDLVERWVRAGGGLLMLGAYGERHHGSNLSELAWRFDLAFADDLVMHAGASDIDTRAHVFSEDPAHGVELAPATGPVHPIQRGVSRVSLVSAGSIRQTTGANADLVWHSVADARRYRPLGHIDADGARPAIDRWVPVSQGAQPLLVATTVAKGRVIAIGAWKLCTVDVDGHARLLENSIRWLAGS